MSRALSHGRRWGAIASAAASLALLITGGAVLAGAASAAWVDVPTTGTPGRLVLASDPYPAQFLDLSPGDPRSWQVEASLEDATAATLELELRKDGELVEHPRGLTMSVQSCAVEWTDFPAAPSCTSGLEDVTVATPADDYSVTSPSFELPDLAATAPVYLLVTLAVEDSAEARADTTLMGITGAMALGLTAVSVDSLPPTPGPGPLPNPLAPTGGDLSGFVAALALAAALLAAGLALRLVRQGERA